MTDLLQSSARQLIKQAVEAEVEELLCQYSAQRNEDGELQHREYLEQKA